MLTGAGALAREAAEALRALNAARSNWTPLGYLDDNRYSAFRRLSAAKAKHYAEDLRHLGAG